MSESSSVRESDLICSSFYLCATRTHDSLLGLYHENDGEKKLQINTRPW